MVNIALEWLVRHWLEVSSFAVTCAALFYAHLAYRTSERGLAHAKQAELNGLRVQAKSAMNDARQAQVSLDLTCQIYRANWASFDRTQPKLKSTSVGMFDRSPIDRVQFEGRQLIERLSASGETVDKMDLQALETLLQMAKATSLNIQALAGKLESPP